MESGRHLYQRHRARIFLTTPIEMAVYIASVANDGKIIVPHLVKNENFYPEVPQKIVGISDEYFKIVKEGMRMAVTEGTAQGLSYPDLKIAAKTGTAEVGARKISATLGLSAFIHTKIPSTPLWQFWKKAPLATPLARRMQ